MLVAAVCVAHSNINGVACHVGKLIDAWQKRLITPMVSSLYTRFTQGEAIILNHPDV